MFSPGFIIGLCIGNAIGNFIIGLTCYKESLGMATFRGVSVAIIVCILCLIVNLGINK